MKSILALASTIAATSIFRSPATDGGSGGGSPAPKTLAEAVTQLEQSRAEVTRAKEAQTAAEAEGARQKGIADAALTEATTAKDQLAIAQAQITTLTGERDQSRKEAKDSAENVERLEKLCGVRGINRNDAPPSLAAENSEGHVYDQWAKATGGEKTRIWRENEKEIRAEGQRRSSRG